MKFHVFKKKIISYVINSENRSIFVFVIFHSFCLLFLLWQEDVISANEKKKIINWSSNWTETRHRKNVIKNCYFVRHQTLCSCTHALQKKSSDWNIAKVTSKLRKQLNFPITKCNMEHFINLYFSPLHNSHISKWNKEKPSSLTSILQLHPI